MFDGFDSHVRAEMTPVSFSRNWSERENRRDGGGKKAREEREEASRRRRRQRQRQRPETKSPPLSLSIRTLFEVHFRPTEAAAQAVQGLARLAEREAEPRKHMTFLVRSSSSSFLPLLLLPFFLDLGGRRGEVKFFSLFPFSSTLFSFLFAPLSLPCLFPRDFRTSVVVVVVWFCCDMRFV